MHDGYRAEGRQWSESCCRRPARQCGAIAGRIGKAENLFLRSETPIGICHRDVANTARTALLPGRYRAFLRRIVVVDKNVSSTTVSRRD